MKSEPSSLLPGVYGYLASSIVGMLVFCMKPSLIEELLQRPYWMIPYDILALAIVCVLMAISVLPFWSIVVVFGRYVSKMELVYYAVSATVIGIILGPVECALGPPMMWDENPEFLYTNRLAQQFETRGQIFAMMGLAAGFTYWFMAIRRNKKLGANRLGPPPSHPLGDDL